MPRPSRASYVSEFGYSDWTRGDFLIYSRAMRARKILVALLAVGYLAAAHCRIACAAPAPAVERSVPAESGCHRQESEDRDSDSPCCAVHLDSTAALPPSVAPALVPAIPLFAAVIPPSDAGVMPRRPSALRQNHGPPNPVSAVLAKSSRGSRPPPFGA